ncbi:MobC family plasmid mobilization relaxosome protein [Methylocella sp.]|uniref:MobC family plasmid mobilization relaxosome protein n=1 Tax=Methylocella sp. TaxID=1978226 RepID=UPI0035B3417B
MARPRKEAGELLLAGPNPRLTLAERVRVEQAAAALGISPSEFMRRRALDYRMPVAAAQQIPLANVATALIRLGNNLNQIAKHMNAGRAAPPDLSDLIARINGELDRLYESRRPDNRPVV